MFSRAHLLIERELAELMHVHPVSGIVAFPIQEDNLFDIVAKIEGAKNTIWESGIFQVYLKFSELYNDVPPIVSFQTIPFHPNIDVQTGKPSIDFLDDATKWKQEYTLKHILLSLQSLLSNPMLDRAVNIDAVFMLKGYPDRYQKIAQDSVLASQRIQRGLEPFDNANLEFNRSGDDVEKAHNNSMYSGNTLTVSIPIVTADTGVTVVHENPPEHQRRSSKPVISRKRISFEDYHRLWKGIATSKPKDSSENAYVKQDLEPNPMYLPQHLGLSIKDLEAQMIQQLNEHKDLMYGKFKFNKNAPASAENKNLQRLYQMKEVYMQKMDDATVKSGSNHTETGGATGTITGGDVNDAISISFHFQDTEKYYEDFKNPSKEVIDEIGSQRYSYRSTPTRSRGIMLDGGGEQFVFTEQQDAQGNWENEVDELVSWTQNLQD